MAGIFGKKRTPQKVDLTKLKSAGIKVKPSANLQGRRPRSIKGKSILAAVLIAASATPGLKYLHNRSVARENARVEHVQKVTSMGLNPKSADVSKIYTNMTPITIRAMEGVCKKVGTTPNRFMFSIESYKNEIKQTKDGLRFSNEIIDSLRNSAMHRGGNGTEAGRRRLRIAQAMIEFGELPEQIKVNIIESTSKRGSLRELRDAIRREGKQ